MQTIGNKLDEHNGLAPGFDFLRIFLAIAVVLWHVPTVAGLTGAIHAQHHDPVTFILGYSILAAFFGLSGFLIAGSAQRLSLRNFLINRGLRIVPALSVEVFLCAVILGPLVTTLTLAQYASNAETWTYFANAIGMIHYSLPGVFKDHPSDLVNQTLWTVPYEILCYMLMSAIMVLGLLRKPAVIVAAALATMGLGIALDLSGLTADSDNTLGRTAHRVFVSEAARLYISFLLGIAVYLYRDKIPYSKGLMLAAALWCLIFPLITLSVPWIGLLVVPAVVYLTMALGVTDIPMPNFLRRADYSYGIYLYGWPMQQLVVHFYPNADSFAFHFIASLALTIPFAMFSWHYIEKPLLQLRKKFSFVATVRLKEDKASTTDGVLAPSTPAVR